MKTSELPLEPSTKFRIKGMPHLFVQVGNSVNGIVALALCSTAQQQEDTRHLLKCWNDRAEKMPTDGEVIFYTVCDENGEERINISVPDESPTYRDVVVHFPARPMAIGHQQLAELGHLFLALSTLENPDAPNVPIDTDSVSELLDGFGFWQYTCTELPDKEVCLHPNDEYVEDADDPLTKRCTDCGKQWIESGMC